MSVLRKQVDLTFCDFCTLVNLVFLIKILFTYRCGSEMLVSSSSEALLVKRRFVNYFVRLLLFVKFRFEALRLQLWLLLSSETFRVETRNSEPSVSRESHLQFAKLEEAASSFGQCLHIQPHFLCSRNVRSLG